ncbi:MAG: GUN4 domain-containing protein [Crocosphaera sp.]|nr:GUN4 domain-containing protein [Crocosphaera sp.]
MTQFEEQSNNNTVGDQPTIEDTLGFTPYVVAIAEFLTHPDTKPPLTISIEGEWGSGKSSFMKQLEAEIKTKSEELKTAPLKEIEQNIIVSKNQIYWRDLSTTLNFLRSGLKWTLVKINLTLKKKTKTVWFNAWRHDKAESLWAAFALSFLEQLSKNNSFKDYIPNLLSYLKLITSRLKVKEKPLNFIQSLAMIVLIGSLIGAILIIYFKVGKKGANEWAENVENLIKSGTEEEKNNTEEEENNTDEGNKQEINETVDEQESNGVLTWLLILGGTGGSVAGIGKLVVVLRDLIGDPKMNLTKYIKSPDYEQKVTFIEQFHQDFSKIVNAYAGKDEKVYVFIDDLDRCELGKSADLLQALNLMISSDPNLIFILGIDREKVAAAITFKQKDVLPFLASITVENKNHPNEDNRLRKKVNYGFNYLEKFIQLSFIVPQPSQHILRNFLRGIDSKKIEDSQTISPNELAIFPIFKKELNKENLQKALEMVAPFFNYNPRYLKRYINELKLATYIAYYSIGVSLRISEREQITLEQIAKFTALILKYPRLLLDLKNRPNLLSELEDEALASRTSESSNENNQERTQASFWVKSDSKLKDLLLYNPVANENNRQIHPDYSLKNESIKKLLQVSPSGISPKYFKLRDFLAAGKWKEADQETSDVMLRVANLVSEGSLRFDDIDNFPCDDLRTIDQLWVHYSEGKFGFSVQQKIYMDELGGTRDYNEKIWHEFCDRVGWREGGSYVSYLHLTFELLDTTPEGHLPISLYKENTLGFYHRVSSLAQRLVTCEV